MRALLFFSSHKQFEKFLLHRNYVSKTLFFCLLKNKKYLLLMKYLTKIFILYYILNITFIQKYFVIECVWIIDTWLEI